MNKKNLLVFSVILLLQGQIFAQAQDALEDVQIQPTTRSLDFYLDAFSGQLNSGTGENVFSGNEFEFGAVYSQNFKNVPWLSIWVKALVVTGTEGIYGDNREFQGNQSYVVRPYGLPRAQIGINFGGHSIIAIDTRGLLANENYYTIQLANNQAITFLTVLELWAVPIYRDTTESLVDPQGNVLPNPNAGFYQHQVLDLFALKMNYSVQFAKDWKFVTKIDFRFTDDRSADLFGKSFAFRWENQIIYSMTPAFYMWGQVRYHIANAAIRSEETHNVYLQAGLGYSFDFSNNKS